MPDNKEVIRMHLESYLTETEQRGNLSAYGLLLFCKGYYGELTTDIFNVVMDMRDEGWVTR